MTHIKKSFFDIFYRIRKNEFLLISLIIVLGLISLTFSFGLKPIQQPLGIEEKPIEQRAGEVRPLAQGKQTYSILTDRPKNPQIIEISLDPLDVKIGETQIITVRVKDTDNKPITNEHKVMASILTDNKSIIVPFLLRRADGPDLITIWEGEWVAEDSHDFIYQAAINAIATTGESLVELSFR
jgi:hypothetical protein